jgi:predicted DNA-binding protein (MmcQ/YjbR family)
MNTEEYREYCLGKIASEESCPFGEDTLVFKVCGKIFALLSLDEIDYTRINLKGDPEKNIELREKYEAIIAGYHMDKKHWNTIAFGMDVPDRMIKKLTDESYDLVLKKVPAKIKSQYGIEVT